ncbi:MAG: hypothetical protein AAF289_22745 [Cyanobacteria bacterium P01_A01_bin.135]
MIENFYGIPYVLLAAGLLAGITSALAFGATVKQQLELWSRNRETMRLSEVRNLSMLVPLSAAGAGVCVFLASAVQIFSFSPKVAYSLAVPLSVLGVVALWIQFGQLLRQAETGGARSLDTNFSIKITQR